MKHTLTLLLTAALTTQVAAAGGFRVTSPQLEAQGRFEHAQVFDGFGCDGDNLSPALDWHNAPAGTRSFAVTLYDPDAPTGSGWWHWVVFNIPAKTSGLVTGAGNDPAKLPAGSVLGRTDYGEPGYGGPCPPPGRAPHNYQFTVYALKTDHIPLDADAPAAMVGFYLHQNLIDSAVLSAQYSR